MIKSWKQGRLFLLPLTTLHFLQEMARQSVFARHYQRDDGSRAQFFHGKIDEFRLYDYALSEDDILYAANDGEMFGPPDTSSNLSYDDIIDFKDFAAFALQWLDSCPQEMCVRRHLDFLRTRPTGPKLPENLARAPA